MLPINLLGRGSHLKEGEAEQPDKIRAVGIGLYQEPDEQRHNSLRMLVSLEGSLEFLAQVKHLQLRLHRDHKKRLLRGEMPENRRLVHIGQERDLTGCSCAETESGKQLHRRFNDTVMGYRC